MTVLSRRLKCARTIVYTLFEMLLIRVLIFSLVIFEPLNPRTLEPFPHARLSGIPLIA